MAHGGLRRVRHPPAGHYTSVHQLLASKGCGGMRVLDVVRIASRLASRAASRLSIKAPVGRGGGGQHTRVGQRDTRLVSIAPGHTLNSMSYQHPPVAFQCTYLAVQVRSQAQVAVGPYAVRHVQVG